MQQLRIFDPVMLAPPRRILRSGRFRDWDWLRGNRARRRRTGGNRCGHSHRAPSVRQMRLAICWMRARSSGARSLAGPCTMPRFSWYLTSSFTFAVAMRFWPSPCRRIPAPRPAARAGGHCRARRHRARGRRYIARRSRRCRCFSWMKATRSASFSSLSTTDSWAMPSEASSLSAFHDQRKAEPRRPLDLAAHREDGEGRHRNAVIGQQLLRQVLAARQHQAARIAAGIGHAHQFEIARDILVIGRLAVKLLQQVEHDVRLPALDLVADRPQLVLHAEQLHLVARLAQRADDVVPGLPDVDLLLAVALDRIRAAPSSGMQQHQDAQGFDTGVFRSGAS